MKRRGTAEMLAVSVVGLVGTRVLTAASGVLLARLLGPELRGEYGLLIFASTAASVLATWGIDVWITRAVASRDLSAEVVRSVAWRHLRLVVVVTLLVVPPLTILRVRFGAAEYLATAMMGVATVWSMLRLAFLGGWLRMGRVAAAQVIGAATYLLAVGALAWADRPSVSLVMAAATVSTAVLAIVAGVSLRTPGVDLPGAAREAGRQARRFGRPAMLGEILSISTYRADILLVASLLGARAVGIYLVAATVSEVLWIVPNGVAQALLPRVASDQRSDMTRSILILTVAATGTGAALVSIVGGPLIRLFFGQAFAEAAGALPLLCAAAVAFGAWKVVVADLGGRGNTSIRAWSSSLALAVMLAVDVVAIPALGLKGAALGSLVAYVAATIVTIRVWLHTTGVRFLALLDLGQSVRLISGRQRVERVARSLPAAVER